MTRPSDLLEGLVQDELATITTRVVNKMNNIAKAIELVERNGFETNASNEWRGLRVTDEHMHEVVQRELRSHMRPKKVKA